MYRFKILTIFYLEHSTRMMIFDKIGMVFSLYKLVKPVTRYIKFMLLRILEYSYILKDNVRKIYFHLYMIQHIRDQTTTYVMCIAKLFIKM